MAEIWQYWPAGRSNFAHVGGNQSDYEGVNSFYTSASLGNKAAAYSRDAIQIKMSHAELEQARELAASCSASEYQDC